MRLGGLVLKKPRSFSAERKLSQTFTTNLALLGLEERSEQVSFANLVTDRFETSETSLIEAGTGIGKTYGYLLSLLAQDDVEQLIVAVPTKVLQDQMMANEVQRLETVFHIKATSLKSPKTYLNLEKFWHSLQEVDSNRLTNRFKMQLLVWLCETETGDLDEIQQKYRLASYFKQLQHDGDLSTNSLFYDYDFWRRHYEAAKSSRLIVTNHAYLLTRVEDDKAFVAHKTLVIDEAQKFFLNLEQFSRHRLLLKRVLQEIQEILEVTQDTLTKRLLEGLNFELGQLQSLEQGEVSSEVLAQLRLYLDELPQELLTNLRECLAPQYDQVWLETESFADHRNLYLCSARLDFLSLDSLLPDTQKTYLISATLTLGSQITLAELLGLEHYRFDRLASSAHPSQQVYIDSSMPEWGKVSEERYHYEIAERLRTLLALEQPILVLFNATKTMLAVSMILEEWGMSHLCQHKNGLAANVKRRFDKGESRLLLGTGSFWEGVDFAHQDKVICVVTKLPFDNPASAFSQKMEAYLRAQGKHPFQDYNLPVMILRLKQAIGRTQRRLDQQSQVLVLDRRLLTKSYGTEVLQALSEQFPVKSQDFAEIMEEIPQFFQKI